MRNAIGLMSGTSLDGVDVAWLRTDGEQIESFGPTGYRPYSAAEREMLRAALAAALPIARREDRPSEVAAAEELVTRVHAEAVESFLVANGIDRRTVDLVGFHGQTVLNRSHDRLTVQIGTGAALVKPCFESPAPISLDRIDFVAFTVEGMALEDCAATLTAFSSSSIARIVD